MQKMFKRIVPNKQAFTLIEMTVVLFIVSILSLLIIPNVASMRGSIDEKGTNALADVIETQAQLYMLDKKAEAVSLAELKTADYISEQQVTEATKRGISLANGEVTIGTPGQ